MSATYSGKVALVTGGAAGIGRATALAFAGEGLQVVVSDLDAVGVEGTVEVISAAGGLGDDHRGQWLPFWLQACGAGNARACDYVERLETTLCRAGSGWACNELGSVKSTPSGNWIGALASWQEGCERGFETACANARDGARRTAPPRTRRAGPPGVPCR